MVLKSVSKLPFKMHPLTKNGDKNWRKNGQSPIICIQTEKSWMVRSSSKICLPFKCWRCFRLSRIIKLKNPKFIFSDRRIKFKSFKGFEKSIKFMSRFTSYQCAKLLFRPKDNVLAWIGFSKRKTRGESLNVHCSHE